MTVTPREPGPGRPAYPELLDGSGSVAHFADPDRYDARYRRRRHDVAWYVARCAGVPEVLEIGAGSGRITVPLARSGVRVTALDRSAPMLDRLRERARDLPVGAVEGDMRTFRLRRRFPLVLCPFNTFLHLYTRQHVAAFLARVRAHLAPGGRLVFDVSMPRPGDLRDRDVRARTVLLGGRRVRVTESFRWEALEQILYVTTTYEPPDGPPTTELLAHRQFFAAELEALLAHSGFAVRDATAWGEPPGPDPDALVFECEVG